MRNVAFFISAIKANKDFELLMIPNARHGFGDASDYMTRRRWDFFVKHLLGTQPPKEYRLRSTSNATTPNAAR